MIAKNLTIEQRRQAIRDHNPAWVERTLFQHLERLAAEFPARPFLLTDDLVISYGQTVERAKVLARSLIGSGIARGDHVAMVMPNCPEFIALRFALAAIGAVGVPINTLLKPSEFSYIIRQSDAKFLVTMDRFRDADYLGTVDEAIPGWRSNSFSDYPKLTGVIVFENGTSGQHAGLLTYADWAAGASGIDNETLANAMAQVQPHDLLDIVYTSGTTGLPKGVMLTHDTVLRCSFTGSLARALPNGNRLVFALPLYHSYAYIEGLMANTWAAGSIVMFDKFDPERMMAAIERLQVNEILLVPTMSIALLEHPKLKHYSFASVHAVMSAAAQAPVRLWQDICEAFGVHEVTTAYGQTELSSSAAYIRPDDTLDKVISTVGRLKPRSVAGTPETDGRVAIYRVADPETGDILPPGEPGELIAFGPEMMRGYYNKPEENAAVFRADGWMRTGDLGYFNQEGYIVLTGRRKELYKCGGELVAPKEIEELLSSRADVSQAYVVGIPDVKMSEVGVAFVVPMGDAKPSAEELRAFCNENLAKFKVPRHVFVIGADELPTTATGKIQKFLLRDSAIARIATAG